MLLIYFGLEIPVPLEAQCILLRERYAVSGTDAHSNWSLGFSTIGHSRTQSQVAFSLLLRVLYAMSAIDMGDAATSAEAQKALLVPSPLLSYAFAVRCPVLASYRTMVSLGAAWN